MRRHNNVRVIAGPWKKTSPLAHSTLQIVSQRRSIVALFTQRPSIHHKQIVLAFVKIRISDIDTSNKITTIEGEYLDYRLQPAVLRRQTLPAEAGTLNTLSQRS